MEERANQIEQLKQQSRELTRQGRIIEATRLFNKAWDMEYESRKSKRGELKIIATQVKSQELVPGDLFSTAGPEYWDNILEVDSIGERVYIRTEVPCPDDQKDETIFRITIER